MKIAFFTYSTKPRGSVVHTLELAEALTQLDHEVWVYALSKDGSGFDRPFAGHTCLVPAQPAPVEMDALIYQRIQELVDYLTQYPPNCDIYHAQDCLTANACILTLLPANIDEYLMISLMSIDESSIDRKSVV